MTLRSLVNYRAWHLNRAGLIIQAPSFPSALSATPTSRDPRLVLHHKMQRGDEHRDKSVCAVWRNYLPLHVSSCPLLHLWVETESHMVSFTLHPWHRGNTGSRPRLGMQSTCSCFLTRVHSAALSGWPSKLWHHEFLLPRITCLIYISKTVH
jgi:hypothetical protein